VVDGTEDQRIFVLLNKQPAVKVSIQKQPDANTIAVVEAVKRRIEELRRAGAIPNDMELTSTLDESVFIQESLNSVTDAALSGAVLAALAVLLFLGSLRQTLIISLTIPLCTLAAAIAMKLCGFSLNVFTLAGLAISVGQAVDTSVVVLENINKRSAEVGGSSSIDRNGQTRQAAIDLVEESSREVESSLVAATGGNLVSVLPFLLIGGFISLLFNELILTICFAVAASLLVAVTVVPMLSSLLITIRWSSRIDRFWLLREFNRRFEGATHQYARVLRRVVGRRFLVLAVTFVVFGGSILSVCGHGSTIQFAGRSASDYVDPTASTGRRHLGAVFYPNRDRGDGDCRSSAAGWNCGQQCHHYGRDREPDSGRGGSRSSNCHFGSGSSATSPHFDDNRYNCSRNISPRLGSGAGRRVFTTVRNRGVFRIVVSDSVDVVYYSLFLSTAA